MGCLPSCDRRTIRLIFGAVVLLVTGVADVASLVPGRRIATTPVATVLRMV